VSIILVIQQQPYLIKTIMT